MIDCKCGDEGVNNVYIKLIKTINGKQVIFQEKTLYFCDSCIKDFKELVEMI